MGQHYLQSPCYVPHEHHHNKATEKKLNEPSSSLKTNASVNLIQSLTFFDFQQRQNAAFSAISSISIESTTFASFILCAKLQRPDGFGRPSGQNAKYDM